MASSSAFSVLILCALLAHIGYVVFPSFVVPSTTRRELVSSAAITTMGGFMSAAKAASSINGVQVKLYSDDVCDSKRIFENVTAAAIPLDSCEKDKSGVAVYYQCTGSNKLHIRVYFRGSCAENHRPLRQIRSMENVCPCLDLGVAFGHRRVDAERNGPSEVPVAVATSAPASKF